VPEYVHVPPGQEIAGIGGRYSVARELRLPHGGRELLVVIGTAVVDNSCCGVGGVAFATVPGFITGWRVGTTAAGEAVSEVEPVTDAAVKAAVTAEIKRTMSYCQVNFL